MMLEKLRALQSLTWEQGRWTHTGPSTQVHCESEMVSPWPTMVKLVGSEPLHLLP